MGLGHFWGRLDRVKGWVSGLVTILGFLGSGLFPWGSGLGLQVSLFGFPLILVPWIFGMGEKGPKVQGKTGIGFIYPLLPVSLGPGR